MQATNWDTTWFSECPRHQSVKWQNLQTDTKGRNHQLILGFISPNHTYDAGQCCIACKRCGFYATAYTKGLNLPCDARRAKTPNGSRNLDSIHQRLHPMAIQDPTYAHYRVLGRGWMPFRRALQSIADSTPMSHPDDPPVPPDDPADRS